MSLCLMSDGTNKPCELKVIELTQQRDDLKKQAIAGHKLRADLELWRNMPAQEMRIRRGDMSVKEIRSVWAVLNMILTNNQPT